MRRQAGRERQPEIERSRQGHTTEAYLNTPQAAKREAPADEEGIKKSIWETPQATETTQQPSLTLHKLVNTTQSLCIVHCIVVVG